MRKSAANIKRRGPTNRGKIDSYFCFANKSHDQIGMSFAFIVLVLLVERKMYCSIAGASEQLVTGCPIAGIVLTMLAILPSPGW